MKDHRYPEEVKMDAQERQLGALQSEKLAIIAEVIDAVVEKYFAEVDRISTLLNRGFSV